MSVIVVSGKHDNWFDAAMEFYEQVERYAAYSLRNFDSRSYWTDKTLDGYMDTVRRKWEKGKDLRLSLRFLVRVGTRNAAKEKSRRPMAQVVKDLQERLDTVVDVRMALRKMDDAAQRILILLLQGYSWDEVVAETGWTIWTIRKVKQELGRLLVDYQPTTPTRQKGRRRTTE